MSKAKNQPGQKTELGKTKRAAIDFANQSAFTLEEHLQVQMKIEKLAHQLWRIGGCALNSTLNDWLCAENNVLAEFTKARMWCDRSRFAPASAEIKTSRKSVVLPTTPRRIQTPLKSKPTAAFQHLL
jgi:cytidylate kinase